MAAILSGDAIAANELPWHALRYPHTAALCGALAARYAPATSNRMLAALRGVLREAWRRGLLPAEEYQRAVDLAPIRGTRVMPGRALASEEVRALFLNCADGTPSGGRHAALLALLYRCGLRRAETMAIDLADFDTTAGIVRVLGEGNKERELPLVNGALEALSAWRVIRGDEPGPFLVPVLRGGRLVPRRMTPQPVLYTLRRRASAAGMAPSPRTTAGAVLSPTFSTPAPTS